MTPASSVEQEPRTLTTKNTTTALRIHFVSVPPAGAQVLARFVDPETAAAVAEPLDAVALQTTPNSRQAIDQLDAMIGSSASDAAALAWLNPPDLVDAPLPVSVPVGRGQIFWRPGRVLLEAGPICGEIIAAIAEFAFYEAQLRRLEEALRPYEASAIADASKAYRMTSKTRDHWTRFAATMESLALLRLTFARLEPRLLTPSRQLPPAGRRLFRQLARRATIEDRLSAANDRLEVCEDLYEGAVDRITDDRWYRKGNLLELIIVVLLLVEVVQLGGDTVLRWMRDHLH